MVVLLQFFLLSIINSFKYPTKLNTARELPWTQEYADSQYSACATVVNTLLDMPSDNALPPLPAVPDVVSKLAWARNNSWEAVSMCSVLGSTAGAAAAPGKLAAVPVTRSPTSLWRYQSQLSLLSRTFQCPVHHWHVLCFPCPRMCKMCLCIFFNLCSFFSKTAFPLILSSKF